MRLAISRPTRGRSVAASACQASSSLPSAARYSVPVSWPSRVAASACIRATSATRTNRLHGPKASCWKPCGLARKSCAATVNNVGAWRKPVSPASPPHSSCAPASRSAVMALRSDASTPCDNSGSGAVAAKRACTSATKASPAAPSGTITSPGLVQNWPLPSRHEPLNSSANAGPRSASAPGSRNTGLRLDSSPKKGMPAASAACFKARPPARLPVKAIAPSRASPARRRPSAGSTSYSNCTVAAGRPAVSAARRACSARRRLVAGCAGCALAMTGLRAAMAAAKSPPDTALKANGKLFGPNTSTGLPSGAWCVRRPAAVSITGWVQLRLRAAAAAWRSWLQVRGSSLPRRRGVAGRPVSACASCTSVSASASRAAA